MSRSGASDNALGRGIEAEQDTNHSIGFDVGSRDDSLCSLSPLGRGASHVQPSPFVHSEPTKLDLGLGVSAGVVRSAEEDAEDVARLELG